MARLGFGASWVCLWAQPLAGLWLVSKSVTWDDDTVVGDLTERCPLQGSDPPSLGGRPTCQWEFLPPLPQVPFNNPREPPYPPLPPLAPHSMVFSMKLYRVDEIEFKSNPYEICPCKFRRQFQTGVARKSGI